jgi:hypothetical protein
MLLSLLILSSGLGMLTLMFGATFFAHTAKRIFLMPTTAAIYAVITGIKSIFLLIKGDPQSLLDGGFCSMGNNCGWGTVLYSYVIICFPPVIMTAIFHWRNHEEIYSVLGGDDFAEMHPALTASLAKEFVDVPEDKQDLLFVESYDSTHYNKRFINIGMIGQIVLRYRSIWTIIPMFWRDNGMGLQYTDHVDYQEGRDTSRGGLRIMEFKALDDVDLSTLQTILDGRIIGGQKIVVLTAGSYAIATMMGLLFVFLLMHF